MKPSILNSSSQRKTFGEFCDGLSVLASQSWAVAMVERDPCYMVFSQIPGGNVFLELRATNPQLLLEKNCVEFFSSVDMWGDVSGCLTTGPILFEKEAIELLGTTILGWNANDEVHVRISCE